VAGGARVLGADDNGGAVVALHPAALGILGAVIRMSLPFGADIVLSSGRCVGLTYKDTKNWDTSSNDGYTRLGVAPNEEVDPVVWCLAGH